MKKIFFIFILSGIIIGCNDRRDILLEEALILAKENRKELLKVIRHYQNDSLKLEAAKFLIRNMPGHYSYADTTEVSQYYDAVDSLLKSMEDYDMETIQDSLVSLNKHFQQLDTRTVQDIEIISAHFLIQNIDSAFVQWKKWPWAQHLSFDQFCEYILPYKTEELQPFDNWRTYLRNFHPDHMNELAYCDQYKNSALRAGITLNSNLWYYMHPEVINFTDSIRTVYRLATRLHLPFGTCRDFSFIASSIFRSQGIPIGIDFTPQWAFRNLGHTWNVLLSNDGKNIPFGGVTSNPGQPHKLDERMPKVFRLTYAINPELHRLIKSGEYVPDLFRYPFIKDVTEEYMDCRDINLKVDKNLNGRHAYLAVFNNKEWVPVDVSRIEKGELIFHKVGMNTVYLPISYNKDGKANALCPPFLFTYSGKIEKIIANTTKRETFILKRKYPVLQHVQEIIMRADSGEFQASNDINFKNAKLLYRITDCSAIGHEIILPDTLQKFQYWRYYQPKEGTYCNIADIRFYERNTHKQIQGKVIGTDGHWEGNPDSTKEKVFDNDLLTFFDAPLSSGAWVGMDFGKPIGIERILFTGRGDGNTIDIGDTYELFYWNNGKWCSLGKQKAQNIRLVYKDVPTSGLYYLKNLTKGKDERIFTYKNGKQIWW